MAKCRYYMYDDTCLPFGLRSAPYLFNQFAKALHCILSFQHSVEAIHYLDDFLLVGPEGKHQCITPVQSVCSTLGIPMAFDKLEGPATQLTFLGIILDCTTQQLSLPHDNKRIFYTAFKAGVGVIRPPSGSCCRLMASFSLQQKLLLLVACFCN